MPVIIHSREACEDTMALVKRYRPRGVVHCFSGSEETAREYLKLGLYIGFTGSVTFKNANRLLLAAGAVPLDRLLLETDCPYLAPVPNRGRRNSSLNLPHVVRMVAELKGVSEETVEQATFENACRFYGISGEES